MNLKQTIPDRRLQRENGSAMLVSLMIMGVATMGIAAWISIINGRTTYTETMEDAMKRRVAHENSRALAEEYMYLVAANEDDGVAVTATIDSGDTAKVQISGWTGGAFESVIQPGGVNRSGMANGHKFLDRNYVGYVRYYDVALGNGDHEVTRSFQLRSRSPIFYGDLVTLNRPTITPGDPSDPDIRFRGNVHVHGRTVLWRPDMIDIRSDTKFRSKEYVRMSENFIDYPIKNLPAGSGGEDRIRASNFPFSPITAGPADGGLGFDGKLSTVENTTSSLNSLVDRLGTAPIVADGMTASSNRGVVSNGSGTISIDLNDEFLTNVLIQNDTSRIILNGQGITDATAYAEAGDRAAILIVIIQDPSTSRNLDQIQLTNRNNRRVVVAVKKTIGPADNSSWLRTEFRFMNADQNPAWRLIAVGENTEIRMTHQQNGSVTVYGGVRTDRGFYCSNSGSKEIFLRREDDPKLLERLIDRNVWLESYAN